MVLSDEERKAKKREYGLRPEVKAQQKEYRTRPEVKVREKARKKKYRERPEVKVREKARSSRPENMVKANASKRKYRERPEVKVKISKHAKEKKDKEKLEVYSHYSKIHSNSDIPLCRCCGLTSHIEFLSLDHITGKKVMDSELELVELGYSSNFKIHVLLNWIIKNNFPKGFQILCHNCNFAKGHSKDNKCPHEKETTKI